MGSSFDWYALIFGIDIGLFVSAFLLTFMFALLFFIQNGFHRFYMRIFGLACISFISITLYNIFFQYAMYHDAPSFYPVWLLDSGKFFAPVALGTITYFFLMLSMSDSARSLPFYSRYHKYINALYVIDAAFFVALFFISNMIHAVLAIEAMFILHALFGMWYFCKAYDAGKLRYVLVSTMLLIIAALTVLSYGIYVQNISKPVFLVFNSILAMAALTLSFIGVRSGFDEAARFMAVNNANGRHLLTDIVRAMDNDEFFLEYQPKRNLNTGEICGFEALIRWHHPKRGRLMPDEFILFTEQSDLINLLCEWVIDHVVAQSKQLEAQGYNLPISLNFSVKNLLPTMATYLIDSLKQHDLSTNQVIVEITESVFLQHNQETDDAIRMLNDVEVMLSIDDYGVGFSSLSYLSRLNVGEIKIDKSFVMDLATNRQNQVIVRSILQMSHELNIRVVAEGVEDLETLNFLTELGCDVIQGYYLAKPMPEAQLNPWLSNELVAQA